MTQRPWPPRLRAAVLWCLAGVIGGCASRGVLLPSGVTQGADVAAPAPAAARPEVQTCAKPLGTVQLRGPSAPARPPGEADRPQAMQERRYGDGAFTARARQEANRHADGWLRELVRRTGCLVVVEPAAEEAARDGATSQAAGAQPTPDFVLSWGELSLVQWRTGSGFGGVPTFGEAMNPSLGTVITLAEVRLTLSDPQRSLQLAAAQGRGSHIDSGLTREFATPAARAAACTGVADAHWPPCAALLLRAFADAHAKLVPLLHAYKTQKLPANAGAPDAPPRSPDTLAGPAH